MDQLDLLGEAGAVYTIDHAGKKYKMSRMTGQLKAEWEMFLRTRWIRLIKEEREALTEEAYERRMDDYRQKVDEGFFNVKMPHSQKMMSSEEGYEFIVKLIFKPYHPDLTQNELFDLVSDCQDEIMTGLQVIHARDFKRAEALKKKGTG